MKWLGSWGRAALCWVPVVADIVRLVVVEVRVARCCCVVRSVTSQMTDPVRDAMVCDGKRLLLRRCYYLEGQALTGIFSSCRK